MTTNIKEQNNVSDLDKQLYLGSYDLLKSTAGWLEDPENEIFGSLEYDDESLQIVAKACVLASAILKKAALDIQIISGVEDTNTYGPDVVAALSSLASIANEFDSSDNPDLVKKASVLDEILLTIAANTEANEQFKMKMARKIEEIKVRATSDQIKAASKSKTEKSTSKKKAYRPLEAPLSTRYCPDHPGNPLARIRDGLWYCMEDSKQYDFNEGFATMKGNFVPGTSVDKQTESDQMTVNTMFADNK